MLSTPLYSIELSLMFQARSNMGLELFSEFIPCRVVARLGFSANMFESIDGPSGENLNEAFSEEEIWGAIRYCDGNKAPGRDCYRRLEKEEEEVEGLIIKVDFDKANDKFNDFPPVYDAVAMLSINLG
ncbi:hypothetical protein RHSIM_Rhsim07G0094900 [Rhododendron simsii]|uniref:Uncharacterized protein n=1 Tax=Rhododendron simsii TaxID=118357 RepID=A0A834LFL7_RHOSS|nr:hypothetical protein RHSIM_Rhsim07G0094900 [Rhododendron simsii]